MSLEEEYAFEAHKETCWAVAIHPELNLMASVSTDKTCKIWDLKTKQLRATLGDGTHSKTTRCVAFKSSVDFPTVAVGSFDATVSIWGRDMVDDEEAGEEGETNYNEDDEVIGEGGWELLAIIEGHENEVKSVDWSHDGKYLATSSRDKSAWIWETDETNEEFECINVIQEHEQDVKNVRWHPSQHLLATCSYDETSRVFCQDQYDEDDWLCVAKLADSKGTVWAGDFDKQPGSMRFVDCSDDSKVRVYKRVNEPAAKPEGPIVPSTVMDEEEWALESVLPAVHDRPVYSVDWSPNGMIASTGCDGRLVVYRETAGKWEAVATKALAHGIFEINCVKWYGDDHLLTAGDDGKVKVWKLSI